MPRVSAAKARCPKPEHVDARVKLDGTYGAPGHRPQRYKCSPRQGAPHVFTELLPREEAGHRACEHCEREVERREGSEGTAPLPVRRPRNRRGTRRRRGRRYLHAGLAGGPRSGPALPLRRGDRRGARVRPRPARRRLGGAVRTGRLRASSTCRLAGRGLAAARPPALPDPSRGPARSRDPRGTGCLRRLSRDSCVAADPAPVGLFATFQPNGNAPDRSFAGAG